MTALVSRIASALLCYDVLFLESIEDEPVEKTGNLYLI